MSVITVTAWSLATDWILFKALDQTVGVRMDRQHEPESLDGPSTASTATPSCPRYA